MAELNIERTIKNFLKEYLFNITENTKEENDKNYEKTIYNEFSLQHELGIYLRNNLKPENQYKVLFEKNIKSFFEDKETYENFINEQPEGKFVKKEIDIVIVDSAKNKYAIELKFPLNGQYPEQMFQFIKDIRFMEQAKSSDKFKKTYCFVLVNNKNFYEEIRYCKNYEESNYRFFRPKSKNETQLEPIKGHIINHVKHEKLSENDCSINIDGSYNIIWQKIEGEDEILNNHNYKGYDKLRYYFLEILPTYTS